MTELVADCPRCDSQKITFNLLQYVVVGRKYDWQSVYETFCICRHCGKSTVFVLEDKGTETTGWLEAIGGMLKVEGTVNDVVELADYVSNKDRGTRPPPDHLPNAIDAAFKEGARCLSVDCVNAAATMFRLCLDHATRELLPQDGNPERPPNGVSNSLGRRLGWLFDNGCLPEAFKELSTCIKDDGNDGAHAGTLTLDEAEDIFYFTYALLERLYTEPKRLEFATERRNQRRGSRDER